MNEIVAIEYISDGVGTPYPQIKIKDSPVTFCWFPFTGHLRVYSPGIPYYGKVILTTGSLLEALAAAVNYKTNK